MGSDACAELALGQGRCAAIQWMCIRISYMGKMVASSGTSWSGHDPAHFASSCYKCCQE